MTTKPGNLIASDYTKLVAQIKVWGRELGFQQIGITDTDIGEHREHLQHWLDQQYHGEMHYMADRQTLRNAPEQLLPETLRIISARMDYLPADSQSAKILRHTDKAYISRYALGRDYHKLIRRRLSQLAQRITDAVSDHVQRPFVDSAPVMERALAEKAGLGWIGKNTMLIHSQAGSWFFLGELFTNLPLPIDKPQQTQHCGSCTACLDICPTQAFAGPHQLDARKCISYLTIELKGSIPLELRSAIGNRVFGCDDCQLVCPWNKFAKPSQETDFNPRHQLDNSSLLTLFLWNEDRFDENTRGSPIRRIGFQRWLRNLAVGIGNGPASDDALNALQQQLPHADEVAREHIEWAQAKLSEKLRAKR